MVTTVAELAAEMIQAQIDAVNAAIKTLVTPVANVKGYGAEGDGATDDTQKVLDAVAALSAAGGGVLYGPPLTSGNFYKVTSTIELPSNVVVVFHGQIKQATTNTALFSATSKSNIHFVECDFLGAGDFVDADGRLATGVLLTTCTNVTFERCRLTSFGFSAIRDSKGTDIKVNNCRIVGTSPASNSQYQFGVSLIGTTRAKVEGNTILNCAQGIIPAGHSDGTLSTGIIIKNNHLSSTGQHGIYLGGVKGVEVEGNIIFDCAYNGIQLNPGAVVAEDVVIKGNRCTGSVNASGIAIIDTDYLNISDNVCASNAQYGIYCNDVRRFKVGGNICVSNSLEGVYFVKTDVDILDGEVLGNVCYKNVRSGIQIASGGNGVRISENVCVDNSYGYSAAAKWGIEVVGADIELSNNICRRRDTTNSHQSGLALDDNTTGVGLTGNKLENNKTYDLYFGTGYSIDAFTGNVWGVANISQPAGPVKFNFRQVQWANAAPTTGTWAQGDIVYDISPAAGGTIGWVCVTGGTPGTWKTFGAITA